jgi:hypothetical protein
MSRAGRLRRGGDERRPLTSYTTSVLGGERDTGESGYWLGPPTHYCGVVVPLNLILARSDRVAILIPAVTVYPDGWELAISVRSSASNSALLSLQTASDHSTGDNEADCRYGVEYPDGRRTDNFVRHSNEIWSRAPSTSELPLMLPTGGGGDQYRMDTGGWIWPLPPVGSITLFCRWLAQGIPFTEVKLDSALIHDAKHHAVKLWSGRAPLTGNRVWTTNLT